MDATAQITLPIPQPDDVEDDPPGYIPVSSAIVCEGPLESKGIQGVRGKGA
jgi:hypothetical protein